MTPSRWISIGALFCALTVILGAMGAHLLKERLVGEFGEWWFKAGFYGGFHALALIALGLLGPRAKNSLGWLFVAGIVLFSGSLYAMALGAPRWFGAITPFGGLAFIAAWLALAWTMWNERGRA